MQCGGIEFFVIFVCYVISISMKVKFSVSHFDGYKRWVCSSFMHIKGVLGVQRMLVMDGNTNASERGGSEGASVCSDLNQD